MPAFSTITLQRCINNASTMLQLRPLVGVGGFPIEPALTIGDAVRQFILSPPFIWRWNRSTVTINLVQGQQDYTPPPYSQFFSPGWAEQAYVIDPTGNTHQLKISLCLSGEHDQNLPQFVSILFDDDNGDLTYRVTPVPDKSYTLIIIHQQAAPTFQTVNDTWAPIPDYMFYLYQAGFIAKCYEYASDERYPFAQQLFMKQLLAASVGHDLSQKNIFLADTVIDSQRQIQADLGPSKLKGIQ